MRSKKMWKGIRKELKLIRKDLKYHILRTDILEKQVNGVAYKAVLSLAVLGSLTGVIKGLLSIFS